VLDRARSDPRISAAAIIGSAVTGAVDRWSDVDLTFGVVEPVETVLADWGAWVEQELGALHHWDLPSGSTTYRVFLLPDCLQVDLSFTPAAEFGARGPVADGLRRDGRTASHPAAGHPHADRDGLAERLDRTHRDRARPALAGGVLRQQRPRPGTRPRVRVLRREPSYARGIDRLPREVTEPFEDALVGSFEPDELW
jgi:hypothetical protein